MICLADTSFLCALYREQDNSSRADAFMDENSGPVSVSSLVLWEFRQSTRFQVFRFAKDRTQGFSKGEAARMLRALETNLGAGVLEVMVVDWADVHSFAERLSAEHTITGGHRTMDILHLGTVLHLGINHLLTFDFNQRTLAESEGISVPL